jgi:hypothetical protein
MPFIYVSSLSYDIKTQETNLLLSKLADMTMLPILQTFNKYILHIIYTYGDIVIQVRQFNSLIIGKFSFCFYVVAVSVSDFQGDGELLLVRMAESRLHIMLFFA